MQLAKRLIESIAATRFDPSRYEDEVRKRIRTLIARKSRGAKIEQPEEAPRRAEVVDLMAALKASLEARKGGQKSSSRPKEARPRRKAS